MEIIIGKKSGFCAGVKHTVETAEKLIKEENDVYCLGEIVHNERVIKKLEDMGMITKESIDDIPENSKVIIRAHGEPIQTYQKAEGKNIKIFDLTCPRITVIKKQTEPHIIDSFIILIGKKKHPETKGVISFCGENSLILESEEDIKEVKEKFIKSKLKKIYIISQTTFSNQYFDILTEKIKQEIQEAEITINKTICNATEKRQEEVKELSKQVDKMIIIGGKHSSNTKELYKIAEENCKESYLVQEVDDLKDFKYNDSDKIGIMAGASTPKEVVDEIIEYLK